MNGINYSALMGNSSFFTNNGVKDDIKSDTVGYKGRVISGKTQKKEVSADKDTFEKSDGTRQVKAGYDRPKTVIRSNENTDGSSKYKELDADGIQEGIKLSDSARKLLDELREKYGSNMEISVAEWDSDEEQDYYAGKCNKDYSVLINPEALEKMAADADVRAKYEAVLGGVSGDFEKITNELGEDADKVKGFSVSIDKDGNVSYTLQLLKDMQADSAQKAKDTKKAQEDAVIRKRDERKKAEKERLEKLYEKRQEEKYEKITASSIEELIQMVKERLNPEQEKESEAAEEEIQTEK